MLDLVIFDCDGVLVDSERLVNRIEAELLAHVGIHASPDETRARFKGCTVGEVVQRIQAETGKPLAPEWLYDWGMHTAVGFVRELQAVQGIHDVLAALDVPSCVASQSPLARVGLSLAVTGLAGHFGERVFTASMVPRPKPHPDLFLYAAARMGADPARCVVVEDSASGVEAAVAAGMRVFGYAADEDERALAAAGAVTFHQMHELPALLAALRQDTHA